MKKINAVTTLEEFSIRFDPKWVGHIASCTAEWRDGKNGVVLGFIPLDKRGQRIWHEGKVLEFFPSKSMSFLLEKFGQQYTTLVKENRCVVQWEK